MLLLVVGLVVLVLVIVVVVFLSVRTMHIDDDDGYEAGAARRNTGGRYSAELARTGRGSAGRGSAGRDSAGRDSGTRRAPNGGRAYGQESGQEGTARPRASQPVPAARASRAVPAARRRPAGDAWPEPARGDSGARRGGGRDRDEQRVPALPRPRGYQHDQDADGWGGVSDEQYWAELSSDKPLATTARSAQAGPPADRAVGRLPGQESPAAAAATQRLRLPADDGQRPGDRQSGDGKHFGDLAAVRDTQSGGTPFGNGAGAAGTPDTNDTDPGRDAGRTGRAAVHGADWGAPQPAGSGWAGDQPADSWGAQKARTSAWSDADSRGTAWPGQEPSTEDWAPAEAPSRGWDTAGTPERSSAPGSPAWTGADDAAGDWRADEPSSDRWAAGGEPGGRAPWDTGSADYGEPYGHRGGYPAGGLDPLPEPAGRAADWHSAPVPAGHGFAADRDGQGWDDGAGYGHDGYPDAGERDGYAGSAPGWEPRGAGRDWPGAREGDWTDPGQRGWPDQRPGSGQDQAGGYHPDREYGQAGGYSEPDSYARPRSSHRGQDRAYGRASHDAASENTSAYELPAYGTPTDGYGERAGYGEQSPRRGYGSR